ncbi:hypothetical protein SVI_0773 [Shewanella violacea DSS12]|uniref:Uncharacterized protein n=1 Tax=Shewanella violacea (strain JCM 10179 / CIP 106290 / LMG 19151 / DSS12) TaxID=637905 RepID=D4ZGE5_SHEVD|nr:hypothetical protein SVI_0773 [Shewanella violacea DSS12]
MSLLYFTINILIYAGYLSVLIAESRFAKMFGKRKPQGQ